MNLPEIEATIAVFEATTTPLKLSLKVNRGGIMHLRFLCSCSLRNIPNF